jgi:hypothetical protein
LAVTRLRTGYSRATHRNKMKGMTVLQRKTHTRTHLMAAQRNRGRKTKELYDERIMGERRKMSKNSGRICEKHRIVLRTIDTKTQKGTKKNE